MQSIPKGFGQPGTHSRQISAHQTAARGRCFHKHQGKAFKKARQNQQLALDHCPGQVPRPQAPQGTHSRGVFKTLFQPASLFAAASSSNGKFDFWPLSPQLTECRKQRPQPLGSGPLARKKQPAPRC